MMMESSNLNLDLHGHHQEEFHGPSPSFAPTLVSSFHFLNGKDHAWNQDLMNCADFTPNSIIGALSSSRDHHFMGNMVQDLGFQWGPLLHCEEDYMVNPSSSSHQVNLSNKDHIKEELLRDYLHSTPSSLHIPPLNSDNNGSLPHMFGGRGSFSMVLPTAIINSSSNSMYSSSLAMGLISNDMGFAYGSDLGRLQEPFMQSPPFSTNNHKIPSSSVSGATKRSSTTMDSSRSCLSVTAKKPRFESRSPFTPFKVRKEKLGDRIAALQQLVAPFGKTDTASVLMEAIGYIKFLQDQVETLSVPYMRSSNNTQLKTTQRASNEEKEELCKPDLRSRGLCLVPLSCTSYFTNETGGIWAPPNYSGGT